MRSTTGTQDTPFDIPDEQFNMTSSDPNQELDTQNDTSELREQLAAIEHERWADWQRWMHKKARMTDQGHLIIDREDVERWERQIATPYSDLSEKEKASDMEQVDRYWHLIEALIAQREQAAELRGMRNERLANAQFYSDKLKPINEQLEHDMKAMQAIKPEKGAEE